MVKIILALYLVNSVTPELASHPSSLVTDIYIYLKAEKLPPHGIYVYICEFKTEMFRLCFSSLGQSVVDVATALRVGRTGV